MKGKISTTIPQRQYENLKTTYYFENEEERKHAIETAIQDCIEYKDYIHKNVHQQTSEAGDKEQEYFTKSEKSLGITQRSVINGIQWRKRKKGKNEWWEYWDVAQSPNKWVGGVNGL